MINYKIDILDLQSYYSIAMIVIAMTRRKLAMIRASHRISDYLECYSGIGIDTAIEFYIRDHYYPEMDTQYRRQFLKRATTQYPPEFATQVKMNHDVKK